MIAKIASKSFATLFRIRIVFRYDGQRRVHRRAAFARPVERRVMRRCVLVVVRFFVVLAALPTVSYPSLLHQSKPPISSLTRNPSFVMFRAPFVEALQPMPSQ